MSYTIGGLPKKEEGVKKEIQSIPSKIHYTGPADVTSNFIREKAGDDGNSERGMFRGRGLEGVEWQPPNGYSVYALKERKGPKGAMLDIESKSDSIKIWEWDKSCGEKGERTTIGRASAYLRIAQSLADEK